MTHQACWRDNVIAVLALLIVVLAVGGVATAATIYVDQDAAGANNGTSWTDAFTDLQDALTAAASGDEIWVAEGTYKPTLPAGRAATFELENGVSLYGGFAGNETIRSNRDWASRVTLLSGDIGAEGDSSDNCYHVVTTSGTDDTPVLDGFTISGGNANGSYPRYWGGGMFIDSSSPTLTHCTFSNNSATQSGRGIYTRDSSPTLTNCTFSNNSASSGGGIYTASSPTLTDCTFNNNSATYGGGMCIHTGSSFLTVTGCTFSDNTATYGGGMANYVNDSPKVRNCTFSNNSASSRGGGMYSNDASPRITNCTLSNNSASEGGGMYNVVSSASIRNTILWGNTATSSGPEIEYASSPPTVTDCVVEGGFPEGTDIITDDPLLGTLGDYGGSTETMPLLLGSSAIDSANAAYAPDTDQRGVSRDASPDIGAYEYEAPAPGIDVRYDGHSITSGDTSPSTTDGTDFGSADIVVGAVDHTFSIHNTGNADLTLSGIPKVAISGSNAADFTVTAQPSSPVEQDSSTTFTIHFVPSAADTRTATVSIANDSSENPYTFSIEGTGSVSAWDVNDDGKIDVLDVRLCLQIAEGAIPGTPEQRAAADVDLDGDVDLTDAQILAEYVIGILSAFPGGG